jgi:pimeloyl-ACP methyl ester carboxylesterase
MSRATQQAVTVVLVHGAWADGSSWNDVILPLQARGLVVIAAPIPLTSLSQDVQAVERVLGRTKGPVVLGAHAYAGAVISAVVSERVRGLVFIAALTPDAGETVADVFYKEKPHAQAPQLAPDADGLLWMPLDAFAVAFAQNAPPERTCLLAATQRPISVACIKEKAPEPAWKRTPSWYLIAEEDRLISPRTQHFLAGRMQADIRIENVDHTPLVSAPGPVIELLVDAVEAVTASPGG